MNNLIGFCWVKFFSVVKFFAYDVLLVFQISINLNIFGQWQKFHCLNIFVQCKVKISGLISVKNSNILILLVFKYICITKSYLQNGYTPLKEHTKVVKNIYSNPIFKLKNINVVYFYKFNEGTYEMSVLLLLLLIIIIKNNLQVLHFIHNKIKSLNKTR